MQLTNNLKIEIIDQDHNNLRAILLVKITIDERTSYLYVNTCEAPKWTDSNLTEEEQERILTLLDADLDFSVKIGEGYIAWKCNNYYDTAYAYYDDSWELVLYHLDRYLTQNLTKEQLGFYEQALALGNGPDALIIEDGWRYIKTPL